MVIDEFSEESTQTFYAKKAVEGLWIGEKKMIRKHFQNKSGKVLDLGCGTGRTTIPLHERGFHITGVDLVPKMIEQAKHISKVKGLDIDYRIGDAALLEFENDSFDYVFFSNQGWTQIPGHAGRIQALEEIFRILKKDGVFIFTAHPRSLNKEFGLFWIKQWFRLYILKSVGFTVPEINYGDRLFERTTDDGHITHQYIHVPSIKEVKKAVNQAGFHLVEMRTDLQISDEDIRKNPPVFYVCKKKLPVIEENKY